MALSLQSSRCSVAVSARPFTQSIAPPRVRGCGELARQQPISLQQRVASANTNGQPEKCLTACRAVDPRGGQKGPAGFQFNGAYAAIAGVYGALFLLQNPYIFAALSILTIIPQNSAITSLNSLVILFYESGLFMNFAEAVYCVRLMTWLSVACTLISFAVFY